MQIFGGVEFDVAGVIIAPHPAVAHGKFELRSSLVSVAHDGAGKWSGHYSPHGPPPPGGGSWEVRLRLPGAEAAMQMAPRRGDGAWAWEDGESQ